YIIYVYLCPYVQIIRISKKTRFLLARILQCMFFISETNINIRLLLHKFYGRKNYKIEKVKSNKMVQINENCFLQQTCVSKHIQCQDALLFYHSNILKIY